MAEVKKTVYLTGFMGTGKSSVGRDLARRLRRPFIDLDAEIERVSRRNVPDLFARLGETRFRTLESAALRRVAGKSAVVALGGGALLSSSNRALAHDTGTIVRLTCARRALLRRLRAQRAARPLLAGGSLEARVRQLIAARRGAYAGADIAVSTTSRSIAAVAAMIVRRLA
jgi:shikimate kinase